MGNIDSENHNSSFKETIEAIKIYLERLLGMRTENLKKNVKQNVSEVLEQKKPEKSFFKKMKDLIVGEDESSVQPQKSNSGFEEHPEDHDKYIPHDMEFGESLGEESRFAEVYPGFTGYYTSGKKSYFDPQSNLWSKKSSLSALSQNAVKTGKSYTYSGVIKNGTIPVPLPEGALPDANSICFSGKSLPIFQVDQNNCVYIVSSEKQYISFDFYVSQDVPANTPVLEDSEKISYGNLTDDTKYFLSKLNGDSLGKAEEIRNMIKNGKKYSTRLQGTLRDKSNSRNYIANLDKSEVLECFSANTLFVALCREIGIPARLVEGYMVQSLAKDGKALLGSNKGHAWSEIWDEKNSIWKRIDATPSKKENGEDSNQNMDGQNSSGGTGDTNMDSPDDSSGSAGKSPGSQSGKSGGKPGSEGEPQQGEGGEGGDDSQGGASDQAGGQRPGQSAKSPKEALEDIISKAKDDSVTKQAEKLKEVLEKLENTSSKEQIRKVLDETGLEDFAKEIADKIGNEEILSQEKAQLNKIEDEQDLDRTLDNSLLDEEFKNKLKEYSRAIRKQIQEQKKKLKSDMDRMGFKEEEMRLYRMYKELEKEIESEVRKQILSLEKILPPKFRTVKDENNYHASGNSLGNTGKLIEHHLTGDPKIFQRNAHEKESNEINMYETVIIDRSGSMGRFDDPNSPLRETVKAAIIRAKVLEYFKVNFSILIFDTELEEVMEFGEKFSERGKCLIPSKLMRAVMKNGGTDIGKPLSYTFNSMKEYSRKNGLKSFGNISFLGDGRPSDGLMGGALKGLINQIRSAGFGLTAYYINGSRQDSGELQDYFGSEESGGTIIVQDVKELTEKLIGANNRNLRKIIAKYR